MASIQLTSLCFLQKPQKRILLHFLQKLKERIILTKNKRDWSSLPSDLLYFISTKLADLSDFKRFRSVCNAWRHSAPVSNRLPQIPFLLDTSKSRDGFLRFCPITFDKIYTIRCERIKVATRAYCSGYILASFGTQHWDESLMLINLVTNDQVHLPRTNLELVRLEYIRPYYTQRDEYVIVMLGFSYDGITRRMAFWQLGDDKWTYVNWPASLNWYACHSSVIYKGMYMTIHYPTKVTTAINIDSGFIAYEIPPVDNMTYPCYFVESCGALLAVFSDDVDNSVPYFYHIFRLDFGEGKNVARWIEVDNIGDQMLFLGTNSDRTWSFQRSGVYFGVSFTASDFTGTERNCIYCIKYNVLYLYNIEDGTTEELCIPPYKDGEKFLHNHSSIWTWFAPRLN